MDRIDHLLQAAVHKVVEGLQGRFVVAGHLVAVGDEDDVPVAEMVGLGGDALLVLEDEVDDGVHRPFGDLRRVELVDALVDRVARVGDMDHSLSLATASANVSEKSGSTERTVIHCDRAGTPIGLA